MVGIPDRLTSGSLRTTSRMKLVHPTRHSAIQMVWAVLLK